MRKQACNGTSYIKYYMQHNKSNEKLIQIKQKTMYTQLLIAQN